MTWKQAHKMKSLKKIAKQFKLDGNKGKLEALNIVRSTPSSTIAVGIALHYKRHSLELPGNLSVTEAAQILHKIKKELDRMSLLLRQNTFQPYDV